MARLEHALDLAGEEELQTKLTQPCLENFDNSLHNAYIWRNYPPRILPQNSKDTASTTSNMTLGPCLGEENEKLDVGSFLGWVGDHTFELLGNEQLHVDLIPLAEKIVQVQTHPQCRSHHPKVRKVLPTSEEHDFQHVVTVQFTTTKKLLYQVYRFIWMFILYNSYLFHLQQASSRKQSLTV